MKNLLRSNPLIQKIVSYGSIEGLAKGLNRGVLLILPLILPTDLYGKVGLIVAAEMLLPFLTLLGFDKAILRFYHEKEGYDNIGSTIFVTILSFQCIVFIIFFASFLLGERDLFSLSLFPDIGLLLVNVLLLNFNQLFLNIQRVEDKYSIYYRNRLTFQIAKFILVVILTLYFKTELGYLLGVFFSLLIVYIFNVKQFISLFRGRFNKKTFKFLIFFSWPFVFHSIAGNVLGNVDRFILDYFVSLSEVGIYTFAYSLGASVTFAFVGISIYMEPLIYKAKTDRERDNLLEKYVNYALISGTVVFLAIFIFSWIVIDRYYQEYMLAYKLIPVIGLSHLLMPFYFKGNYRLVYDKKPLSVAKISIFSALLNVVFNILLIPIIGLYGAAYATFIAYFIMGFLILMQSNSWKYYKEMNWMILVFLIITISYILNSIIGFYIAIIAILLMAFMKMKFKRIKPIFNLL